MKRFTLIIFILALAISSGCSTPTIRSNTMANPAYDVASLKTYAWPEKQALTMVGVLVGSPVQPMENNIKDIFQAEMSKKGYQKVNISEQPDFLVSFAAGAADRMSQSVHSVDRSRLYHDQYVWSQMNDYVEGGLAITFLDPADESNIWQGTAGDRVKPRESKREDSSTIKRLISEILKSLPAAN